MFGRSRWSSRLPAAALAASVAAIFAAPASALSPVETTGFGCFLPAPGLARTAETCGASILDGRAVPPAGAPTAVRRAIAAANRIDDTPYVWGGGHRGWSASGYDCSGAVGYALHAGDLLDRTMVSGELAGWGEEGPGRWITVYANYRHVYMVIAGLRFDTRDPPPGTSGPRWHLDMVDSRTFVARHPAGF